MTVNDFMAWLRGQTDIPLELGNLNANTDRFIAIYPIPKKSVQTIGNIASYDVKGVRLKIRYGNNFTTAENKVLQIKQLLDNVRNIPMNKVKVYFINTEQPKYDGKDKKGIFEFTLNFEIFHERSK